MNYYFEPKSARKAITSKLTKNFMNKSSSNLNIQREQYVTQLTLNIDVNQEQVKSPRIMGLEIRPSGIKTCKASNIDIDEQFKHELLIRRIQTQILELQCFKEKVSSHEQIIDSQISRIDDMIKHVRAMCISFVRMQMMEQQEKEQLSKQKYRNMNK
ncbi:Hypothetical_protein [Hexamita inflata]|uniref:Hypothetical_protein n=1 Tax=Hexamita inflata TaxID=28002 RepID=A0AA86QPR5_9EUKA|nr:Hypothetical protein HINF_LOCUS49573 [Hexamita inflata]